MSLLRAERTTNDVNFFFAGKKMCSECVSTWQKSVFQCQCFLFIAVSLETVHVGVGNGYTCISS